MPSRSSTIRAMYWLLITSFLMGASAAPMQQSLSVNDDGTYQFFYETGKDAGNHKRTEVRQPDGVVVGRYSYEDPNGEIREVRYRADDGGYVANGDVSVEGAPKGQFPASEGPEEIDFASDQDVANDPKSNPVDDSVLEEPETTKEEPETTKEEPKTEDHKDLHHDEPSPDDPPEAFPQGYFVDQFQGLRRFPDVTSDEPSSTEIAPAEVDKDDEPSTESVKPDLPTKEPSAVPVVPEDPHQLAMKSAHDLFLRLRPFQSFPTQQVDSPMFHQPVYVFSYQHPDSYGYHYFF